MFEQMEFDEMVSRDWRARARELAVLIVIGLVAWGGYLGYQSYRAGQVSHAQAEAAFSFLWNPAIKDGKALMGKDAQGHEVPLRWADVLASITQEKINSITASPPPASPTK